MLISGLKGLIKIIFPIISIKIDLFYHRHVERLWGASGDLWQGWWMKFHALFGGDDFLLSVGGKRCALFS